MHMKSFFFTVCNVIQTMGLSQHVIANSGKAKGCYMYLKSIEQETYTMQNRCSYMQYIEFVNHIRS